MGACFLYGSGGGSSKLDLRVFGGLTAPANPRKNDIWIETSESLDDLLVCNKSFVPTNRAGRIWIKYEDVSSTYRQWLVQGSTTPMVSLPLSGCAIGNGTTWTNITAYLRQGDFWREFSKTFSARINVTYPAGSTCTITNGSQTYTAPNTTGTWNCDVDSTGSWTVTATSGSQTASSVVSITSDGQNASVSLSYDYVIFQAGGASDYSGGWTALGYSASADSSGIRVYTAASWAGAQVFSSAAIDVSRYSKLNINVIAYNEARPEASFGLSRGMPNTIMWNGVDNTSGSTGNTFTNKNNCAAVQGITSTGVKTLDISSLSGSFYFWTGEDGALGNGLGYTIGTVWLS